MFIKPINLAIRFFLELGALASLCYWGFQFWESVYVKFIFGIGSPLLFATIWGIFIAPKASLKLPEPYRFMLEIILFGVTSVALYVVDQITLAIILGMVFVINRTLIIIWKQ
ncbi:MULTISPECIES: YrdB family protein [Bacillus]|uniref:YrdB family protein n=1 Tax=Bacillus TaxID=1386 RepID=UPI002E050385|nr:YrdB family protein [Bacillus mycoides]MEC5262052.1 YrdB family protein [Bacillus mycoides]